MQEKVVFDTNIYIGLFNQGWYQEEFDGMNKVMYLVHPVLHELWIRAKGSDEIRHLTHFGRKFIQLGRMVSPEPATQILIGQTCQKLRRSGKLNPAQPRIYNDICIALLARQIGATVVTRNIFDFEQIKMIIDIRFRDVVCS